VQVLAPDVRAAGGEEKGKGVTARGVWRKPHPKMRGDEQEPDGRCGTPETSEHLTAKSSRCVGVCLINPSSTHRKLNVLPREICMLSVEAD
jgi:hypothetical protein